VLGARCQGKGIDITFPVGFLGEAGRIEFRAEMFNIFNRVNFRNPSDDTGKVVFNGLGATAGIPLATAGQLDETSTTSRQIQLALKLIF
jgi:hypothetical protein